MATSTIHATYQGIIQHPVTNAINWSSVRNASTGTFANTYTSSTTVPLAILTRRFAFGRSETRTINRTYLFFDLSSISGTITSGTLKVLGGGGTSTTDTIAIKSTAWGGSGGTSTLATSDFGNVDFVTPYVSELFSWSTTGYNDFTLNTTAISDANTNGYLNFAVIEGQHDYDNVDPALNISYDAGVEFLDQTYKIKLEVTYTTGYGNDVMGVSLTNIVNVIGVASANIDNIIGV